ncbi:hypothetical protein FRB95_005345 [Tulasnella sp. JGI-2019a]|nr:hypothetical protein FRB95_005345 [Tulasnella sp. JGI-2019a]
MPISIHQGAHECKEVKPIKHGMHSHTIFGNNSKEHPMSCGVFMVQEGEATAWTYPCSEFVICLDGEIHLEDDAEPGKIHTLKSGDVARVDEGTKMKWSSPSTGKGTFDIT